MKIVKHFLLAAFIVTVIVSCGNADPAPKCHDRTVQNARDWDWRLRCQSCVVEWSDGSKTAQCPPVIGSEDDGDPGENQPFKLYLQEDKGRIGKIPDEQLCDAEFWGHRLFSVCVGLVQKSGALKNTTQGH